MTRPGGRGDGTAAARTSKKWIYPLLGAVVVVAVAIHWPRSSRAYDLPAVQGVEQLAALPDDRLVNAVVGELRWHLSDAGPSQVASRWRALADEPRHVLALSWVEDDNGPGSVPQFTGFANQLAIAAPHAPSLAELAAAYRAIGAPGPAAVVDEARQLAERSGWTQGGVPPAGRDPFGELNRRYRSQAAASGVVRLLRAYVRANLDTLAAVRTGR